MEMKSKIDEKQTELMRPDSKIGILGTEDAEGYPHLTFISSLQGLGEEQISFGSFSRGESKSNLWERPDAAFLILTAEMEWLKGNARYTHTENTGTVFEEYNNKPLFRYNTYFGFAKVYVMDLIRISGIEKLPMPKIIAGAILTRIFSIFAAKNEHKILRDTGKALIAKLDGLKFISWHGEDGLLEIEPIIQAGPAGTDRVAFFRLPYGDVTKRIPNGAKAAILCLNLQMQSVLVKGIYQKSGCLSLLNIERVYNSMPPKMEYIYPRADKPLVITDFR
ncbi:MAG: hypothetical protein LBN36_04960 [Clostridiales Family XIII bacterium]|jgi:hypothetical protein|nr:hypothetical protein [Clostridiales Family XIII bacterium]